MKKRIFTYLGYGLFSFFLFLLFAYIMFPYEKIKERIITSFENRFAYNLIIKELHPLFPAGLDIRGIEILTDGEDKKLPVFQAQRVTARVLILPLLRKNLNVSYSMDAYDGLVKGIARIESRKEEKKSLLMADFQGIDLARFSLFHRKDGPSPSGRLKGQLKLALNNPSAPHLKGKTTLEIDNGKITGINVWQLKIREISCKSIEGDFEISRNRILVNTLLLQGEDLDADVEGTVLLGKEIGQSILDLRLRLNPKKRFERRYRTLFTLLENMKGKQGSFALPG